MRYRLLGYMKPTADSSDDADESSSDESVLMALVRSVRQNSPIKSAGSHRIHPQDVDHLRPDLPTTTPTSVSTLSTTVFALLDIE